MKTNQAGIELIKKFEGLSLKPYTCSAGKLTIGVGHVILANEKFTEITEQQAEEILKNDLAKFEDIINSSVKVKLTENQFSSLVSFTFNVGGGNFQSSTMLKLINENNLLLAGAEFIKWIYVNKNPMLGIARRRCAEMGLFYA